MGFWALNDPSQGAKFAWLYSGSWINDFSANLVPFCKSILVYISDGSKTEAEMRAKIRALEVAEIGVDILLSWMGVLPMSLSLLLKVDF